MHACAKKKERKKEPVLGITSRHIRYLLASGKSNVKPSTSVSEELITDDRARCAFRSKNVPRGVAVRVEMEGHTHDPHPGYGSSRPL